MLKSQIIGLNRFLSDIYEEDMRLSTLLSRLGLSDEEIRLLGNDHVPALVEACVSAIEERSRTLSGGARLFVVLAERYGLQGRPTQTLQSLGDAMGISRERVRQLQAKAVKRYRSPRSKRLIEEALKATATALMTEASESQVQMEQDPVDDVVQRTPPSETRKPDVRVAVAEGGVLCLTIAAGGSEDTVVVHESDFVEFYVDLHDAIEALGWGHHLYAFRKAEIQATHRRAYELWTPEEEATLRREYDQGRSMDEISALLGRQPSAVASRLKKLRLLE